MVRWCLEITRVLYRIFVTPPPPPGCLGTALRKNRPCPAAFFFFPPWNWVVHGCGGCRTAIQVCRTTFHVCCMAMHALATQVEAHGTKFEVFPRTYLLLYHFFHSLLCTIDVPMHTAGEAVFYRRSDGTLVPATVLGPGAQSETVQVR